MKDGSIAAIGAVGHFMLWIQCGQCGVRRESDPGRDNGFDQKAFVFADQLKDDGWVAFSPGDEMSAATAVALCPSCAKQEE